jgi:hypothetical protein
MRNWLAGEGAEGIEKMSLSKFSELHIKADDQN